MSRHDLEILRLEKSLARRRNEISTSVTALADRLKPANLINGAIDRVAGRAATVASEALEAAKTNSGKATLLGAGALLSFEVGRRSGKTGEKSPAQATGQGESLSLLARCEPGQRQRVKSMTSTWQTFEYWGGGAASAALGYALGKLIPVSALEKELVGGMPSEFRGGIERFWQEHAQGAKSAAADSFGLARLTALGLGIMAALGGLFKPGDESRRQ